jgi:hypothetical protein
VYDAVSEGCGGYIQTEKSESERERERSIGDDAELGRVGSRIEAASRERFTVHVEDQRVPQSKHARVLTSVLSRTAVNVLQDPMFMKQV